MDNARLPESEKFLADVKNRIRSNGEDSDLVESASRFIRASISPGYSYNFSWLGRPVVQYPQDIVAMQELLWNVKPDLVIETGIAHGGSLILSASMLELNAHCGGPANAEVLGIDIDIRAHNRAAIESHPMSKRISMLEGSSTDEAMVERVTRIARGKGSVVVVLDSNHSYAHVLSELRAYAPLTTPGSYCVVFDTIVEQLPLGSFPDRGWGPGNSPLTAVREFLLTNPDFESDRDIDNKIMISAAPRGYLRRVGQRPP